MFLVTGVGHSGTKWAARLFTHLGHECGHERWHGPGRYSGMSTSDSSWLAVANLEAVPAGTRVVHLVRDPLAVVNSMLRAGFLDDWTNPYARFVAYHRPDITVGGDLLDRTIRHACRWDEPLSARSDRTVLRVEDAADPDTAAGMVASATGHWPGRENVAAVLDRLGTRVNTHRRPDAGRQVSWPDIHAHPRGRELAARAEWYGYPGGGP